jgi:glycosyltransferase involved in cell wall biosynthesis
MSQQQPTLSVIMPNYNHAHFLPEALEAILSQSYQPMEIIIIDDASTDNSVNIIEAFAREEPRIRLIRSPENRGPIYNATRLLELSCGDYVYGAAADDKVLPGFLEESMRLLARYPQAGLCSTLSRSIDESGGDKGVFPSPLVSHKPLFISPQESLGMLRKYGSWIKGNTTIYRRNALIAAGGFIPELQAYTDGFIQQVIALRHGVCFVPKPLACFRELPTSYSSGTAIDINRSVAIAQHAKQLMCTTYRDLFPLDYVAEAERRWIWSAGVSAWYSVRKWQERYLTQVLSPPNRTTVLVDRAFRMVLLLSIRAQSALVLFYWLVKLRSLSMWLLRRWIKRAK